MTGALGTLAPLASRGALSARKLELGSSGRTVVDAAAVARAPRVLLPAAAADGALGGQPRAARALLNQPSHRQVVSAALVPR